MSWRTVAGRASALPALLLPGLHRDQQANALGKSGRVIRELCLRSLFLGRWPGGLLFGAFFMANDPVTSPFTLTGRWLYGIMLGILTVLIRALSGLPESVMFAILLMNAVTPLIDGAVVNLSYRRATTKVRRLAA